jgi:thiol-disulfide isomerase/thioredoxin
MFYFYFLVKFLDVDVLESFLVIASWCVGCMYSKVPHFLKNQESTKVHFTNLKFLKIYGIKGSMVYKKNKVHVNRSPPTYSKYIHL